MATPNYEHALSSIVQTWLGGTIGTDELVTQLRTIPAASRNKHQGTMLQLVVTDERGGVDAMSELLNAFQSSVGTVTRTEPRLDEERAAFYRDLILDQVMTTIRGIGPSEDDPQDLVNEFLARIEAKVETTIRDVKVTKRGTPKVYKVTLRDLVETGTIEPGTTVSGPKGAHGEITESGMIATKGGEHSVSRAAELWNGCSTNGWEFWAIGDNKLSFYRS